MSEEMRLLGRALRSAKPVTMRDGVVQGDNGDGTCDVRLGGDSTDLVIPHLAGYTPTASDVVLVLSDGQGGMVVVDRYA